MKTKQTVKTSYRPKTERARPGVHPHAILTERNVERIRRLWKKDRHPTMAALAEHYGVSIPTISHVVYGLTWVGVGDN